MRAQRLIAAVERAAAESKPVAPTHVRAVDLDGWRERLTAAVALAPTVPVRAWRFAFVVAMPLERDGRFVPAVEGGLPPAMLRSASALACIARGYAAAMRGVRGKVMAVEAAR